MIDTYPPTIIFRHKKENLKKCSLRGLEKMEEFRFFSYPCKEMPPLNNVILLTLDAPVISEKDGDKGLCLVDATWNYATQMIENLDLVKKCTPRSLPSHLRTAYPRKQTGCSNPEQGLASIEALFAAYLLLGRNTEGLLDNYYWKNQFLEKNQFFLF